MATIRTPAHPPVPDEEFSPPLPPNVSPEPVPLELAPIIPFTEEEKRLIEEGRAEYKRTGQTHTSEEIRQLLDEKRRRGG